MTISSSTAPSLAGGAAGGAAAGAGENEPAEGLKENEPAFGLSGMSSRNVESLFERVQDNHGLHLIMPRLSWRSPPYHSGSSSEVLLLRLLVTNKLLTETLKEPIPKISLGIFF